jgi:hypothetical protein
MRSPPNEMSKPPQLPYHVVLDLHRILHVFIDNRWTKAHHRAKKLKLQPRNLLKS